MNIQIAKIILDTQIENFYFCDWQLTAACYTIRC
jgi:hypothetical protein